MEEYTDQTAEVRYPAVSRTDMLEEVRLTLEQCSSDAQSRALIIYGDGGIGKTSFLRTLQTELADGKYVHLGPYDVDDAEYWLLGNLERRIIKDLDPQKAFFGPYFSYLSRLPANGRMTVEALVAYFLQGARLFRECYERCIKDRNVISVLALDTLESIRGLAIQPALLRWLKDLPGMVVIFASRPVYLTDGPDTLAEGLQDIAGWPCSIRTMVRFSAEQCREYLVKSMVGVSLTETQLAAAVSLSEGYPLWLAMTVNYLEKEGIPKQLNEWQHHNEDKLHLQTTYLRELMRPYRSGDFWFEIIKRLGVVRRRVSLRVLKALMKDTHLPPGWGTWEEVWNELLVLPWVRPRANSVYITLHDAFAEALAEQLIPLEDLDGRWREALWKKAAKIYTELVEQQAPELEQARHVLGERLGSIRGPPDVHDQTVIDQAVEHSVDRAEHFLIQTTAFYYQLLSDRERAVSGFIETLSSNKVSPQLIYLKYLEIQPFLLGSPAFSPLKDIVTPEIKRFQQWYSLQPNLRYTVETKIASHLSSRGTPKEAMIWLDRLINDGYSSPIQLFELFSLRGRANLAISGNANRAYEDYARAYELTKDPYAPSEVRHKLNRALRELGWYYRVVGDWGQSEAYYRKALQETSIHPSERRESVQLQYNYSYVLALMGRHEEAKDKVNLALICAKQLGDDRLIGLVLNVQGAITRMAGQYADAVRSLREARDIFVRLEDYTWLGTVEHHLAMCLHKAAEVGDILPPYASMADMRDSSRELVVSALKLCRSYHLLHLPAALHRAGLIFSVDQRDKGLVYFSEGNRISIEIASRWGRLANAVEYVSLAYKMWRSTGDSEYREKIDGMASELSAALDRHHTQSFVALRGRWEIVQAHCKLHEGLASPPSQQKALLDEALRLYVSGYLNIARDSSQASRGLRTYSVQLPELLALLPPATLSEWLDTFDREWRSLPEEDAHHIASLTTLVGMLDARLRPYAE